MHRNYFTLYHTARELHEQLAGGFIFEIFSQRKNELTIAVITNSGNHLQLKVVASNPRLGLCVRRGLERKKRNTAALMQEVNEAQVIEVRIDPGDRIIDILLDNDFRLELQLFAARTNVLLWKHDRCISSFKKLTEKEPQRFSRNILRELEKLAYDEQHFLEQLSAQTRGHTDGNLAAFFPGFDKSLQKELYRRAGNDTSDRNIYRVFVSMFHELLDPVPAIVTDPRTGPGLTILETSSEAERFDSMIDTYEAYCGKTWQFEHLDRRIREFRQTLQQREKKARNLIIAQSRQELEAAAERYTNNGHLLLAQPDPSLHASSPLVVADLFSEGNSEIGIDLDERLSLKENAERYFRKAAKARSKSNMILQQNRQAEAELNEAERLLSELERLSTMDSCREFLERHGSPRGTAAKQKKASGRQQPFRTVDISPATTLYLGKNATGNDQLTFRFAKPHDIWLHARGTSGSHGILKGCSMQNRTDITRAAEIVAYHSPARHSELVPVSVTEKKYIRKFSRSAPGQVKIEREEVIMVHPRPA
ncbi:NFACT family protein [Prosthecochloris sp. HL-130-GSB]|jgi:predicted ribosome quality control (RQC) complex YloA/Tae2 family protein|uniref:NFACT family protein n=1 Tax=Prosthecochloris sp. HL-130-GSB TaxID=1974213 RepID=UPI000A1C12F9|nr:NFACT family protein [Prosthecochloris sp. HL-130-GSB]ARM31102.1 hypothetical protein B9H02_07080 [Prosthecochloris sp. HL-130-GSB]